VGLLENASRKRSRESSDRQRALKVFRNECGARSAALKALKSWRYRFQDYAAADNVSPIEWVKSGQEQPVTDSR